VLHHLGQYFPYRGLASARLESRKALAQAVVDTVREPLLVLDKQLRVVAASRSFYLTFHVNRQDTQGQLFFELGNGQWDIPALRALMEKIVPEQIALEGYEVEHDFPDIGRRIMVLNARKIFYEDDDHTTLLLAIEDVTQRRGAERRLQHLLQQKELLLEEMQHRVGNSLQIIASILMLKARTVASEETRLHLKDAYAHVMSLAAVQQLLCASRPGELMAVGPYLQKLCATLAASMIGESRDIVVEVDAQGATVSSSDAVSVGLIVTECMINALKHAFPQGALAGRIAVTYENNGLGWKLSIADNGAGKPSKDCAVTNPGLGTSIVSALAEQLHGHVSVVSSPNGTTIFVEHATSPSGRLGPMEHCL
jgi:two-component sensor histidine kinase